MDGKHVEIKASENGGSSTVTTKEISALYLLCAIVDAHHICRHRLSW
jgi:hypothetical protein